MPYRWQCNYEKAHVTLKNRPCVLLFQISAQKLHDYFSQNIVDKHFQIHVNCQPHFFCSTSIIVTKWNMLEFTPAGIEIEIHCNTTWQTITADRIYWWVMWKDRSRDRDDVWAGVILLSSAISYDDRDWWMLIVIVGRRCHYTAVVDPDINNWCLSSIMVVYMPSLLVTSTIWPTVAMRQAAITLFFAKTQMRSNLVCCTDLIVVKCLVFEPIW